MVFYFLIVVIFVKNLADSFELLDLLDNLIVALLFYQSPKMYQKNFLIKITN